MPVIGNDSTPQTLSSRLLVSSFEESLSPFDNAFRIADGIALDTDADRWYGKIKGQAGLSCMSFMPDSEGVSGVPPCRRCVEQQLECVLTKSRRGGRRIKGVRTSTIQLASHDNEGHDLATTTHDDDGSDYHSRQTSHSHPDQHPAGTDDMRGWLSSQQTGNWQGDSHDEGVPLTSSRNRERVQMV
ncbi:hypothetical protein TrVFT333_007960 [Trichoderma virens FT-333]|nr:hypothetical protein TrVFT333_007960 [Trichoderma virens FT-333]